MASVVAGTRLGQYEIVKHLATGGMAELLIARTRGLVGFERHVVIKRIRADHDDRVFVDMFLNEASLAALLHHHNIVQVLDIGEEDGKPYFAMEYVHGEDLRKLLFAAFNRKEPVPIEHVVSIVKTIAVALHHAHEQRGPDGTPLGIVHRDVTPGNILVGYDGNVKVVDFGIAKAANGKIVTQAGMRKGKAPYMSPEQCRAAAVDRRSDLFALGIVLHETVTGRRLFKGPNEYTTMRAIVNAPIPLPSTLRADVPPALEEIVMRALQRDVAARYQTADEMVQALDAFAGRAGIRTSANGLADYMKHLFGTRPEPWRVDEVPAAVAVDFDETVITAPPEDSHVQMVAAAKPGPGDTNTDVTPLEEIAVQPAKKLPPPRPARTPPLGKPALPSVLARSTIEEPGSSQSITKVAAPPTAAPSPEVVEQMTEAASVPPPPAPVASVGDTTAIVKPLPSPLITDAPRTRRGSDGPAPRTPMPPGPDETLIDTGPIHTPSRRPIYLIGGIAATVVVAILVIVIGFGGGSDTEAPATPKPVAETKPVTAPPPVVDEAPRHERTWANSEKPPEIGAPPAVVAPEPASAAPQPSPPPPAPVASEPVKPAEPVKVVEPVKPPEPVPPEPVKAAADEPAPVDPETPKAAPTPKPAATLATRPRAAKVTSVKRADKPPAKPAKPPAPKWNPNSLFPSKK